MPESDVESGVPVMPEWQSLQVPSPGAPVLALGGPPE
jgi:hypothetical protein